MMLLCVLFVVVAGVAAERNGNITTMEALDKSDPLLSRVINGYDAVRGQFPWQVFVILYRETETGYCGGSLIHSNWVLTAAHCAQGVSWFTLKLGGITVSSAEPERIEVVATRYYVHPGYNPDNLNNDLALIQLDNPLDLGGTIGTIRLPACGQRTGALESVVVSGFGRTSIVSPDMSNQLKYADLTTIANADCVLTYGVDKVTSATLCCLGSNSKSPCHGDSGGPLVKYDGSGVTQVGINSFVSNLGCGHGSPSGYIRTESYLNWIYQTTGVVGQIC